MLQQIFLFQNVGRFSHALRGIHFWLAIFAHTIVSCLELISPVIAPSPLEVEAVAATKNGAFFPRGIAVLFLNHVLKIIDELKIKIKILPNTCD
jgi:hypothetical protein